MDDELCHLVERQDALVSQRQALEHGLTPAALRHALRPGGPWRRVLPGVYATFTGCCRISNGPGRR